MPRRPIETVFAALADSTRMRILDRLAQRGPATATELGRHFPITRQAIAKHLRILSGAGLTARERAGREVRYRFDPKPLGDAAGWIGARAPAREGDIAGSEEAVRGARVRRRS